MAIRKKTAKKAPAKKASPAKKPAAKKTPARKVVAKSPAKRAAEKKSPIRKRDDLGAPADAFFERQPKALRGHLEALRAVVKKAVPETKESIKWGMPYYEMKKGFAALYASDSYAAIQIMAPPDKLDDPEGLLEGKGATMRHLKVRSSADLHEQSLVRWLKTAAALKS